MPDSLRETDHTSFDYLSAEGMMLLSNHHNQYLSYEQFRPIFEELIRRKAIVLIHPGPAYVEAPARHLTR